MHILKLPLSHCLCGDRSIADWLRFQVSNTLDRDGDFADFF